MDAYKLSISPAYTLVTESGPNPIHPHTNTWRFLAGSSWAPRRQKRGKVREEVCASELAQPHLAS